MFFFKKNTKDDVERLIANIGLTQKIKDKLAEISQTNIMLSEAVSTTQTANVKLALKLRNHFRNNNKSFDALSEKLTVGVMVIDNLGNITHINTKAKKILNVDDSVINNPVFDLILAVDPIDPPGTRLVLDTNFFRNISEMVVEQMNECSCLPKKVICKKIISELSCSIKPDEEQLVSIKSVSKDDQLVRLTFSILDNEPEVAEDVTYVIIFHKSKK